MRTPAKLPETGSLADVGLPNILLRLYGCRFTGTLSLEHGHTRKSFVFRDGAPASSESSLPSERLIDVFVDSGTINHRDARRVEATVARKRCPEAVALLELDQVDPKALFSALRELLRRRMIECFGWIDGRFALATGTQGSDDLHALRVDPYRLVQEGLRTHWSFERMLAGIQDRMDLYPRPTPRLAKVARRLALDGTVERMIASLSGRSTFGAIIGAAATSAAALAAFWVLDAADALQYHEQPAGSDREEMSPPEIEIEILEEGAPAPTPAASPRAAAAEPVSGAEFPEAEKMRAEINARLDELGDLDYYELLGLERDAKRTAIRKAYFLAAKRYHPDALARLGLQDMREAAGQVFAQIALANETLSDEAKRQRYDDELSGDAKTVDVTTIAQAETFYRKGEILIRMGDFRGALEYLRNAVDLYPDEAAYQSDLAWTYYKKTPSEREPALAHIQKALELDPGNKVATFRMGVITRGA